MENLFENNGLFADLINYIFCFVFSIYVSIKCRLGRDSAVLLAVICLIPFFLNGVLFSPNYMPDQYKYFSATNIIRSFEGVPSFFDSGNVVQASYFFSIIPIPLIDTVRSLGFSAKFVYLAIILFLHANIRVSRECLIFLFIYPSLLLYSSLGLRDILILFFMLTSLVYLRRGSEYLSILCALPLYFIKSQNFYIQVIVTGVYILLNVNGKGLRLKGSLYLTAILYVIALVVFPFVIDDINKFRVAMFIEDGGEIEGISLITSTSEFLSRGVGYAFYFLLKPFPWEASNSLQLIQSFENIAIGAYMFYLGRRVWQVRPERLFFWLVFIIISSMLYGLVVSNYGTASRYRFPFIVCYIVMVLNEITLDADAKKKNEESDSV